jgi:hypothetical protein
MEGPEKNEVIKYEPEKLADSAKQWTDKSTCPFNLSPHIFGNGSI